MNRVKGVETDVSRPGMDSARPAVFLCHTTTPSFLKDIHCLSAIENLRIRTETEGSWTYVRPIICPRVSDIFHLCGQWSPVSLFQFSPLCHSTLVLTEVLQMEDVFITHFFLPLALPPYFIFLHIYLKKVTMRLISLSQGRKLSARFYLSFIVSIGLSCFIIHPMKVILREMFVYAPNRMFLTKRISSSFTLS